MCGPNCEKERAHKCLYMRNNQTCHKSNMYIATRVLFAHFPHLLPFLISCTLPYPTPLQINKSTTGRIMQPGMLVGASTSWFQSLHFPFDRCNLNVLSVYKESKCFKGRTVCPDASSVSGLTVAGLLLWKSFGCHPERTVQIFFQPSRKNTFIYSQ